MVAMGSIDVLIDLGGGFILGLIAGFLPVEDNVSDNIYLLLIQLGQRLSLKFQIPIQVQVFICQETKQLKR